MAPVYKFSSARSLVGPNTYYSSVLAGNSVYAPIVAGGYDLIQTYSVDPAVSGVSFTSLGDYIGTYQHFEIRMVIQGTTVGTNSNNVNIVLNSDTTADYYNKVLEWNGTSGLSAAARNGDTEMRLEQFSPKDGAGSYFGVASVFFADALNANKKPNVRYFAGSMNSGQKQIAMGTTAYNNTGRITRIDVNAIDNFAIGSRISLYGLAGA